MPSLRDLEVHVTDGQGTVLDEYGVQKISKSNLVSCFIESKSDQPFRVTVKPTAMPFPGYPSPRRALPQQEGKATEISDDKDLYEASLADTYSEGASKKGTKIKSSEPRFHLLATMRLDGREKHEKQIIVYLDENDPSYGAHRDGVVIFRARLTYDSDGNIRESGWVFKDVGIDDLFRTLDIGDNIDDEKDRPAIPLTAEDELTAAFDKLGSDRLQNKAESKAGQIEITLDKITVKHTNRGAWRPPAEMSKDEAGARSSLRDNITHTVGRDDTGRTIRTVDAVIYEPWPRREERRFATFLFYYRARETLVRFGFPGIATGALVLRSTGKAELARGKLLRGSGMEHGGRRKRDGDHEVGGPVKEGRWEMSLQLRDGRGGEGKAAAGEEKVLVGEDKAASGKKVVDRQKQENEGL